MCYELGRKKISELKNQNSQYFRPEANIENIGLNLFADVSTFRVFGIFKRETYVECGFLGMEHLRERKCKQFVEFNFSIFNFIQTFIKVLDYC